MVVVCEDGSSLARSEGLYAAAAAVYLDRIHQAGCISQTGYEDQERADRSQLTTRPSALWLCSSDQKRLYTPRLGNTYRLDLREQK